jgi:hypothetical protein
MGARTMNNRLSPAQWLRIGAERAHAYLGWAGVLGTLIGALALASLAWLHHTQTHARTDIDLARPADTSQADATQPERARLLPPALPHASDTVDLLKRLKTTIQAQGLSWPQAEYRMTPLSDQGLATLEIRTTLKGPYPKLRTLVADLLDKEPALALRELTMTRPNGDTPDIEAKIRWVVFLADGWPPANPEGSP